MLDGVETGRYMLRWQISLMAVCLHSFFTHHYRIVETCNS